VDAVEARDAAAVEARDGDVVGALGVAAVAETDTLADGGPEPLGSPELHPVSNASPATPISPEPAPSIRFAAFTSFTITARGETDRY
jgi:hypothetical protein